MTIEEYTIQTIREQLFLINQYGGDKERALLSITYHPESDFIDYDEDSMMYLEELEEIAKALEYFTLYFYAEKYLSEESLEETEERRVLNLQVEETIVASTPVQITITIN